MNTNSELLAIILRASLFLAVSGVTVFGLLRLLRIQSPWLHRLAWALVIGQGILFVRMPIELPVLAGKSQPPAAAIPSAKFTSVITSIQREEVTALPAVLAPKPGTSSESAWSASQIAIATWFGGMLTILCVYFGSYAGLMLSLRKARLVAGDWQSEWQQLQRQRAISKPVPLLVHANLGPLLCLTPRGYRVVVSKSAWESFSKEQRLAILEHEMTHLKRGDAWKSLIARLLILPQWFNPVAWWAVLRFDEAAEWACDQTLRESSGKRRLADYAKAILALAEPQKLRLATSFAGGAAISPRIRRIVEPTKRDQWVKRVAFITIIGILGGISLFQLELVAQEMDRERDERVPSAAFEESIQDFASRLQVSGKLLEEFKASLSTKPGKIVLKDRAAWTAEEMRDEAEAQAVENFVAIHFDGDSALTPKDSAWRDQLIRTQRIIETDLVALKPVLEEVREKIRGKTDAEKLFQRFLSKEESVVLVYMEGVREILRPGVDAVAERLGEIFVRNTDDHFEIPEGSRNAEWIRKQGLLVREAHPMIHEELAVLLPDIAEVDEFAKNFKKLATEPAFAMAIACRAAEDEDHPPAHEVVNRVFRALEEVMIDRPDGLHFVDDERGEIGEFLERYAQIKAGAEAIGDTLTEFASQIEPKDDLHRDWIELFEAEEGHILFAFHTEIGVATPEEAVRELLSEGMRENDDGWLEVRPDREETLNDHLQELLAATRELRRKGRTFDSIADKINDEALAEAFRMMSGKLAIVDSIRRGLEKTDYDGFDQWIEDHFVESEDGELTLRADAVEMIEEMLEETGEIEKQLKSDF